MRLPNSNLDCKRALFNRLKINENSKIGELTETNAIAFKVHMIKD